jgi:hypothetical protein
LGLPCAARGRQLLRGQSTWLVNYAKRYRAGIRVGKSVTASGIWRSNDVTVLSERRAGRIRPLRDISDRPADIRAVRRVRRRPNGPHANLRAVGGASGEVVSSGDDHAAVSGGSDGGGVVFGQALLRGTTAEVSRSSIRFCHSRPSTALQLIARRSSRLGGLHLRKRLGTV